MRLEPPTAHAPVAAPRYLPASRPRQYPQRLDVLPNTKAETFAAWLHAHPVLSVISRDRAGNFAEGARTGALQAIQVADRWHVFGNLGDAKQRLVADIALRLEIARVIRQVRPATVLTCDPRFVSSPSNINHPDHCAADEAALAAIMPSANTRLAALELLKEGLEPHDVGVVCRAISDRATRWVPLEQADMEGKMPLDLRRLYDENRAVQIYK